MRVRHVALVLAFAFAIASSADAHAVDRSSIATVPKPTAAGIPWTPSATQALGVDLDALLAVPPFSRAHVGVLALDTATGVALYERHADEAFQPASTLKLLVGSVALDQLGPSSRLHTSLTWRAPILTLHAGGDALLAASDLAAAARAVAVQGIHDVGQLEIDARRYDGAHYPPGWTWDDFAYAYAPIVSAAALEDGALHVLVAPGASPIERPTLQITPLGSGIRVRNNARTIARGSADTLDIERDGDTIVLTGAIPLGTPPEDVLPAVPDAIAYMRGVLSAALERAGVHVRPPTLVVALGAPAADVPIWSHDSAPLSERLADFWYPSDNLIGELLLKELAAQAPLAQGTTQGGIALERTWLTSIGADSASLALSDGSGLSVYNRISPRTIAAILQHDWASPQRDVVLDALPVAGVRGTLAASYGQTSTIGRVFAKTGSLSHVSTLAGFLRPNCRPAVTLVFDVDDYVGPGADLSAARGRVLSRIISDPC